MNVVIRYKTVGPWYENSYCIRYGSEAFLVDPGDEFLNLKDFFLADELQFQGIINTHGHFDHVGAVSEFKKTYNLPFYLHSKDKHILRQANLYKKLSGKEGLFQTPAIDIYLDEIKELALSSHLIKVHHTPGHTNGSVCFEVGKNLISGDLLFKDAIGRVDLPGGNKALLKESIEFVTDTFLDYIIYPGHGTPFVLNSDVVKHLKSLI